MLGVICTPKLAERATYLSDGAACVKRLAHGGKEVRVRFRHPSYLRESLVCQGWIPLRAATGDAVALAALDRRIDVEQLDLLRIVIRETVHTDDDTLT
jgi:hypothetical protein